VRNAEVSDLVIRSGGIVRARALLDAGATREDLRRACAAEVIERIREGVYCVPPIDPHVRMAAMHGGELGCVSALRKLGVWVLDDERKVHVWLGSRGRRMDHAACSCVSHHDGGGAAFGSVGIVRALVQAARCLGAECFFAAFESAWRQGLLDRKDRAEVRAGLPARMRWLVDIARPDADSGLESILRLRLHRLGIRLDSQVSIAGVGDVDFVLDGLLILEVDGRENHDGFSKRHKDLVRDARAAAAGYETLRFDYALVIHDWPTVEKAIMARREIIRRRLSNPRRRSGLSSPT
jgi:very-short-patch-repair endonuclease